MTIPTVQLTPDNRVISMAALPANAFAVVNNMPSMHVISVADYDAMLAAPGQWRYVAGVLTAGWGIAPDMTLIRLMAQNKVDAQAEKARLAFITPGSGQALEYQATQDQAAAAVAAVDPLNAALYPWLVAEQMAQASVGTTVSLRDVAGQVLALTSAWANVGASIKEIRRGSKLQISVAPTEAGVNAILAAIVWPAPPGTPAPSPSGTPAFISLATP